VALRLLDDHVRHCVVGSEGDTQAGRLDELMDAVGRLVKA
jgi:DNA-binding FrmR family transcriptional regulator